MNAEYQTEEIAQPVYSPFWPLFILMAGLILWTGFQAFSALSQAAAFTSDFKQARPTIEAAQKAQSRLYALAQDLVQTSAKDSNAAQIVKEAGIQLKSNGTEPAGH